MRSRHKPPVATMTELGQIPRGAVEVRADWTARENPLPTRNAPISSPKGAEKAATKKASEGTEDARDQRLG